MPRAKKFLIVLADIIILYASLAFTMFLRYGQEEFYSRFASHIGPFSILLPVWIVVFYLSDLYRRDSFADLKKLSTNLTTGIIISGTISIALFYLFGNTFRLTPKTNFLIFVAVFTLANFVFRTALMRFKREKGTPVMILGDSLLIRETLKWLEHAPHAGYRITRHISDAENVIPPDLSEIIAKTGTQMVIADPKLIRTDNASERLYSYLPSEVLLMSFPNFYELVFEKVPLHELEQNWFIDNIKTRRPFYDRIKRTADILLSLILSLICLIPGLVIALLVCTTSSGPTLYSQKRAGKNGFPFTLYKFRTMRSKKQDEAWDPWTLENDSRITPLGKILRFTHLDEIPQLWNILKGDISFIGPRPESVELAQKYSSLPFYGLRHIVKPGLTGWAQINYRPSASIDEASEKLEYDIYYVKNRSFILDALILLRTTRYIFLSYKNEN